MHLVTLKNKTNLEASLKLPCLSEGEVVVGDIVKLAQRILSVVGTR
jgi:hypothetical protein